VTCDPQLIARGPVSCPMGTGDSYPGGKGTGA